MNVQLPAPGSRLAASLRKEATLLLRDRKAMLIAAFLPILTIWAYSYVEPPAEVRFDEAIFRTTDPTALIVSLAVMFPAFMFGSSAIVRERTAGTLERMGRTPMRTAEFLGAKLAVLLTVSLVQVLLVLVVAMATLDNITIRDAGGFVFRLLLVAAAFLAMGLFVSALAATENQALVLTTTGVLVMLVLCGFLAPLENLGSAEHVARLLPYTHAYLSSYFYLKGLEPDGPYLAYLALDAVILLTLAAIVVHRQRTR